MAKWCNECCGMVNVNEDVSICRHCGSKLLTMDEWVEEGKKRNLNELDNASKGVNQMRKIKITVSTIWSVDEKDNDTANLALVEQPKDIAYDYISICRHCGSKEDALHRDPNMETPTVKWEEIE